MKSCVARFCCTMARSGDTRQISDILSISNIVRNAAGNTDVLKQPRFFNMSASISGKINGRWMHVPVGLLSMELFKERKLSAQKRYVELGLLPIKNMDLPEKLSRNTKQHEARENKRNLGNSIEERPETVDLREEFGHWEIDSVLGKKNENEPAVVALTERKLRNSIWLKVKDHSAKAVDEALDELFETFGDKYREVFKTITSDNGSEFANLSRLEDKGIGIYFTHPYTSCEKGTVECHNRMLRRFIPKGQSIDDYSADEILIFADIMNALPRKLLGYHTPEELFDAELDRIYAV